MRMTEERDGSFGRVARAWRRHARCSALVVGGGLIVGACGDARTEVVLTVFSDVECNADVAVAMGKPGELGDRPESATSTVCDPATGSRGVLVLVPKDSDTGELAVEVRIRADKQPPTNCIASLGYDGCIIARRILNYIPGRSVKLRVDLRNPCLNTPCTQTTSCVTQGLGKSCVEARIDPTLCSGTCTDEDLVAQDKTPHGAGGADGGPGEPTGEAGASGSPGEGGSTAAGGEGGESGAGAGTGGTAGKGGTGGTAGKGGTGGTAGKGGTGGTAGKGGSGGNGGTAGSPPVDPCAVGMNPCTAGATCIANGTVATCKCPAGFENSASNATQCVDIDECQTNTDNCAAKATCTNTSGSFGCKCLPQYSGDGKVCTPLCATAPAGLAAWWTGDTDGTDLVAAHHATLTSTTAGQEVQAGAAGTVNGSFTFAGATSYARAADNAALDVGTGDFSIAMWIRSACSAGTCVFLDKRIDGSGVGYSIFTISGVLGFQLNDPVGGFANYSSVNPITDDKWHFVVVSVQRASATGLNFYIDNKLDATANPTNRPGSLDNDSALFFGSRSYTDVMSLPDGHPNATFMDEVQLYKRALTAAEVQAIWTAGANGVCKL
jgi:hypothetical protein